ncbi:SDR family oxidoreductase [Caballeronia sp. LZ001]|uniref:SDR family oxidoreductase n=1 Tax=Caballeronia sp. LZ001 TaxID=3038553 RepID=UPI002857DD19|nr:SDR family oxidoreductase [Caballeronia sp. LZ001]MDR5804846.1 SDR family oxidoreductase [Caballeronia sp. LZ001]
MTNQEARKILITGASSGIGAALVRRAKALGWQVFTVDLHDADWSADLGDPGERATLAQTISGRCQTLDAVVCCAGLAPPGDPAKIVGVNFFGVTELLPKLLPLLQTSGSPRAVVVGSIASVYPTDNDLVRLCLAGQELEAIGRAGRTDGSLAYASSKQALAHWLRRNAVLPGWADRGVLLNGIAPGTVKTAMALPLLSTVEGRQKLARAAPIAVTDYAEPDDIAPILAFLASSENRFMVGQIPFIDGGSQLLRENMAA